MKTALIKTSFWDDDIIYQLNIDTKLLYIFLNTAPERNTTRFYKLPDRLISAHIGISDSALRLCKEQLEEKELVFFKEGWVILGESSYVKPATGKLTYSIYQQDVDNVPEYIKQFALEKNLTFELSTEKSSGVAQEYNNKDNNKDNVQDLKSRFSQDKPSDAWRIAKCDDVWEETDNGDVKFKR